MRIDPRSLAHGIRASIRRPLLAALPLAAVATTALTPAATPAAAQSAAYVTLYRDINYLGYSGPPITLYANTPDLQTVGFNDVASSLTMAPGTKVALFENVNYFGACTTFTANDPDLRDNPVNLNDRVSSVLFGQDCPLQLYDSAGYNGPHVNFWNDVSDLGNYSWANRQSFADTVASLRVPPGKKVTAYSAINYGGICEEFTADDPDLSNNPSGTDRISSVKFDVSCPPTVVLFDGSNYGGEFLQLALNIPEFPKSVDLAPLGWANRVSSVHVAGGASVALWDGHWGTGGHTTVSTSQPSLTNTAVGDNTAVSAIATCSEATPASACH
jgi:hypothetical protein